MSSLGLIGGQVNMWSAIIMVYIAYFTYIDHMTETISKNYSGKQDRHEFYEKYLLCEENALKKTPLKPTTIAIPEPKDEIHESFQSGRSDDPLKEKLSNSET